MRHDWYSGKTAYDTVYSVRLANQGVAINIMSFFDYFWVTCLQVYSGDNETTTKHSLGTSVIQYAKENSLKSLDVLEAFVY